MQDQPKVWFRSIHNGIKFKKFGLLATSKPIININHHM
jgi:hypothetical protein